MTAHELIEEGIDEERGRANVAAILGGGDSVTNVPGNQPSVLTTGKFAVEKPPRKRRSDAGTKRPAQPQAKPGVLTAEQVSRIEELVSAMNDANTDAFNASQAAARACKEYYAYLDELQGKERHERD